MSGPRLALALLGVCIIVAGCDKPKPAAPAKPQRCEVRIKGQTWNVELATTIDQRFQGLSGRTEIAGDDGMLFVYPKSKVLSFCMRGCPIPIDILFIDSKLRVVNLYEMQVEADRAGRVTYSSHLPVCYVLELAGGTIRRMGLKVGDVVEFPAGQPDRSQAQADK